MYICHAVYSTLFGSITFSLVTTVTVVLFFYYFSGELHPLDVAVNAMYKTKLKENFVEWYAQQVGEMSKEQLERPIDLLQCYNRL